MTLLYFHALRNLRTYLQRIIYVYIFILINLFRGSFHSILLVRHILLEGNLRLWDCARHVSLSDLVYFLATIETSTDHVFFTLFLVILLRVCIDLIQITLVSVIIPLFHFDHLANFCSIYGCRDFFCFDNAWSFIFLCVIL